MTPLDWSLEPAVLGDGVWFVAILRGEVRALVPPGVRVSRSALAGGDEPAPSGWRMASWYREASGGCPRIDRRGPDRLRGLDTEQALRVLPARWHEQVWRLLLAQLEAVRTFGRPLPGHPPAEELARASAAAALWFESELERAFPERVCFVARRPVPGRGAEPGPAGGRQRTRAGP